MQAPNCGCRSYGQRGAVKNKLPLAVRTYQGAAGISAKYQPLVIRTKNGVVQGVNTGMNAGKQARGCGRFQQLLVNPAADFNPARI